MFGRQLFPRVYVECVSRALMCTMEVARTMQETVHSCLWSGITSLSNEQRFVEPVFDGIICPWVMCENLNLFS